LSDPKEAERFVPTDVLATLFNTVRDAVVVADAASGQVIMWNEAAESLFGYGSDEANGMLVEELVPGPLKAQHRYGIRQYGRTGHGLFIDSGRPVELPALHKSGEEIDVEVSLSPVRGASGEPLAVAIIRDISQRKRLEQEVQQRTEDLILANEQLKQLSETDPLTGLANRSRAVHVLEKFALLAVRNQRPLALAVLDLDNFKSVNDQHGHLVGDEVLRQLGDLLKASFRGEDVVGRWGGEEFLVGMYGSTKADAVKRISAVLATLRDRDFGSDSAGVFHVTFSGGVAEFPLDAADVTALFELADRALYAAKAAGRDAVLPS
jgi:diguanylate cyclase (GGDEF)-like protein/PAS domain S-box-containing protein